MSVLAALFSRLANQSRHAVIASSRGCVQPCFSKMQRFPKGGGLEIASSRPLAGFALFSKWAISSRGGVQPRLSKRRRFPKGGDSKKKWEWDKLLDKKPFSYVKEPIFHWCLGSIATGCLYVILRNSFHIMKLDKKHKHENDSCPTDLEDTSDLPESFDWRLHGAVTPVSNQGLCGSCNYFGALGSIEGAFKIKTGKLVQLSVQECLDCDMNNFGCWGGSLDQTFRYVKAKGIGMEADYPYVAKGKKVCSVDMGKPRVKIDGFKRISFKCHSEASLMRAVVQQPIVVEVVVGYRFSTYKKGIYKYGLPWFFPTKHALLIVGYGTCDEGDYWICKNSWGKLWGQDGYIYLQRNSGTATGCCGILSRPFYPIIRDHGQHEIHKMKAPKV